MSKQGSHRERFAGFRQGDAVTIRSLEEILATLDADAKLAGLPFMPEMVPCCGQSGRVFRRADRTCVEGLGLRSMNGVVFIEGLRCDGSAHDGCQRGCLFFWNEAWLKSNDERKMTNDERPEDRVGGPRGPVQHSSFCIQHSSELPTTKGDRFYCQSTELVGATSEFVHNKLQPYLHDLRIGQLTWRRFAYTVWLVLLNRFWRLLYGRARYHLTGEQKKTLSAELNLQPGELVEIKSPAEIETTLDSRSRNRGLSFEPEMALLCGRRYRVAKPVRKIILEETGKMAELSNTVILEDVVCQGICLRNCPRANYLYWREIWLKRV